MVAVKTDKISGDALGTGRRKTAVARVRVRAGSGKITVNGRAMEDFFHVDGERRAIQEVLQAVGKTDSVDILIRVSGGGPSGQAGACRMGIARALISYDTGLFNALRDGQFLTRDSRMKERKKYGLRGARRGVQFSKR
jgi:small subunit ribosomal protein S9